MIDQTTHLNWLLLTKRPASVATLAPPHWMSGIPAHVWIGASSVNQTEAEQNTAILTQVPTQNRVLSLEPLLSPIVFTPAMLRTVQWVIVGDEIGPKARSM